MMPSVYDYLKSTGSISVLLHTKQIFTHDDDERGVEEITQPSALLSNNVNNTTTRQVTRSLSLPKRLFQSVHTFTSNIKAMINNGFNVMAVVQAQEDDDNTIKDQYKVIVIGGGSAGINVTSQLFIQARKLYRKINDNAVNLQRGDVLIVEPSQIHYYQPLWTLIGGGSYKLDDSCKNMKDVIPKDSDWLQDACTHIDPDNNLITTKSGKTLHYEYLVVVPGMKINYGEIKGLYGNLKNPDSGVATNYSEEFVDETFKKVKKQVDLLKKQRAEGSDQKLNFLFTTSPTKIKCGGAPLKIQFLIEDYLKQQGVRDFVNMHFYTPADLVFGVPYYAKILDNIIKEKNIDVSLKHTLLGFEGNNAIFKNANDGSTVLKQFDFIHVAPHLYGQDFLRNLPSVSDAEGYVKVNKETLQHVTYPNIFSCGDGCNVPTSKTVAALTRQTPVLVDNLLSKMLNRPLGAIYDGYSSCPIVTSYNTLLLAEFKYDGKLARTFHTSFFNQDVPRRIFFLMKEKIFPISYWNLYLKGRWYGPTHIIRKERGNKNN